MPIRRMIGGAFATITIIVTGLGLTAAPASALPRECTAIWDNIHYDAERVSYYTYDHPDPVGVMTFQAFLDDDLQEARNMGCPGA